MKVSNVCSGLLTFRFGRFRCFMVLLLVTYISNRFSSISGLKLKSGSRRLPGSCFTSISGPWPKSGSRRLPGSRFKVFLTPGSKGALRGLQEAVLKHFWPQAQEKLQEVSRRLFWSISGRRPKSNSRRSPGGCFEAFLASDSKVAPGDLQKAVLKHFWPQAKK